MFKKVKALFGKIANYLPWEMGYKRERPREYEYGKIITEKIEEIYFIGNEKNVTDNPFWKLVIDLSLLLIIIVAVALLPLHVILKIIGKRGFFQLNPFHFNTEGALSTIEK